MNSIVACVEYDDFLAITLPRNLRHFERTYVVTAFEDARTRALCRDMPGVVCYPTTAFYDHGAAFNKGAALEACFRAHPFDFAGWICHWDADVLLPKVLNGIDALHWGWLHQPLHRRNCDRPHELREDDDWGRWPIVREADFVAGFLQLFHGSDPVLRERPWYPTEWTHAGNSDTFFNQKWPKAKRAKLPFEVLHLGEPFRNWYGRQTPRLDGRPVAEAERRAQRMAAMRAQRRRRGNFEHERISTNGGS